MPRIVKADAEQLAPGRNSLEGYYRVSNTIEIKKGWRPEGDFLKFIYDHCGLDCTLKFEHKCTSNERKYNRCIGCSIGVGFRAGFDACIEAMEKL
jgi:hypothetical protein